jgi:predicted nuclease of predicted toxin-antitoxin system
MARLGFCVDEHVPAASVTALESNGYTLVTNDRDFARLEASIDHAGIVCYTTRDLTPGEFVRAIRRVDRHFTPEAMTNTLVWLESWL